MPNSHLSLSLPTHGPWSWTCLHELVRDGDAHELVLERKRFRRVAIGLPVAVALGFAGVLWAVPDEPDGFSDVAIVAVATALAVAMVLGLRKYRQVEARRGPALRFEPGQPEPLVLPRAGRRAALDDLASLVLVEGDVDLGGDQERAYLLTVLLRSPDGDGRLERHDLSRGLDGRGLTRLGDELAALLDVPLQRSTP